MPRSAGPAGNVVATAADLVTFAEALTGGTGTLLRPDLAAAMLEPAVPMRAGHQGLGWTMPMPGVGAHGGTTPGGTAVLAVVAGLGAVAVVADGPGAAAVAAAVRTHLSGGPGPAPGNEPGTGPEVEPEACAGRYARRFVTHDIAAGPGGTLTATTTFDSRSPSCSRRPRR